MNLILLLMSKDSYTNMSQMLVEKFLAFIIPKSLKYTVLMEAHDYWVTKVIHTLIA